MKKLMVGGVLALLLLAGLSLGVASGVFGSGEEAEAARDSETPERDVAAAAVEEPSTAETPTAEKRESGMELMARAAKENKYLFGFFWDRDDEQTAAMKKVFEEAMAKVPERATAAVVRVTDSAEREIVRKFGLDHAPMPLALAVAPNGAVMGGFPRQFTEQALLDAFSSPGMEKCMKALQDRKLVLLCVQNGSTQSNAEALQGVQDFTAEAHYASATEVVKLDPADEAEASFLADLRIDPQTKVAVTVFLAPPGSVIAEFEGATEKDQLVSALLRANASRGCGPSGCGPR